MSGGISAAVNSLTKKYGFKLLNFDYPRWGTEEWTNWQLLDSLLSSLGAVSSSGVWANNTGYTIGMRVTDTADNNLYQCQVSHVSAIAPTTFTQDRTANPTYWTRVSNVVNYRGNWAATTYYNPGDIAIVGSYKYYYCLTPHTSAALFATDLAANRWTLMVDFSPGATSAVALNNDADQTTTPAQKAQWRKNLALIRPAVRHCATTGPAAFVPTSSVDLTLRFQNTDTTPLRVTCAYSEDGIGALDYLVSIISNPTIALPASQAFVGVYFDFDAMALGTSLLVPIYQYGGAISTVNGQYTFDYQAYQGWVGNGATAVKVNRVYLCEAVTSATAITSIIQYAYQGKYESAWIAGVLGASAVVNNNHNLGVAPQVRRVVYENVNAENGYNPGERVSTDSGLNTSNGSYLLTLTISAIRNVMSAMTSSSGQYVLSKINLSLVTLSNANWRYRFEAQRGW